LLNHRWLKGIEKGWAPTQQTLIVVYAKCILFLTLQVNKSGFKIENYI